MKNPFKLFDYAHRYLLGYNIEDSNLNGEFRMLEKIVSRSSIVFEVGANVGNHITKYFHYNKGVHIHAFEPSPGSFGQLQSKFSTNKNVVLNNIALSDAPGEADFYLYWETGGGNSIHFNEYQASIAKDVKKIKVAVNTLDNYIAQHSISQIDFIKMDVEGHEYKALLGLSNSLRDKKVKAIQYEYTSFTNEVGDSLTKISEFLESFDFKIYRITPWGKLRIRNFSRSENRSGNYLAILNQ